MSESFDERWTPTGVFLSLEQREVVREAKERETIDYVDMERGTVTAWTVSYKWHVREFAEAAGLFSELMIFEVSESGEILTAPWRPPEEEVPR